MSATSRRGTLVGLLMAAIGALAVIALWWSHANSDVPIAIETPAPAPPQASLQVAPTSAPASAPAEVRKGVGAPQPELLDGDVSEPVRSLLGRVRGRLGWQMTGLPLAGAVVRAVRAWPDTVLPNDVEAQGDDRPPLRRADLFVGEESTTDRFGMFEVAVPEIDGPLALLALRNGQCIEVRPLQPGPAAREVIELGDWLLQQRGEVSGCVVDPRGQPVAGARVRLVDVPLEGSASLHPLARAARLYGARDFAPDCLLQDPYGSVVAVGSALTARDDLLPFPEATTGAGGDFVLRDARPGMNTLVVQPEAAPNLSEQVLVQSGAVTDIGTLRVADALRAGRLVDDEGHAIALGEVAFLPFDSDIYTPPVATDAEGGFSVRKLARAPLRAVARRSVTEPWQPCELGIERDVVRVFLQAHQSLTVDVQAPDGSPKSGCRVEVRHARIFGRGFDEVTVLPEVGDGRYEAMEPAKVLRLLVVRADGFAPLVCLGVPRAVRLRLRTFSLAVLVRGHDGQPAARAQVLARVRSDPQEPLHDWDRLRPGHVRLGETDENGELRCDGMWPAMVEFIAFHPRLGAAERALRVSEQMPACELVLGDSARGRLRGVLTENHLPPQDRWLVVAQRIDPPAARRTTLSEKDGTFAFDGLLAGVWRLDLAVRAGPNGAVPLVADLQWHYRQRGWSIDEHRVELIAGVAQHTSIEIRRWVEDTRPRGLVGCVRIDGVARRGLTVQLHQQPAPEQANNQQRIDELLRGLDQPSSRATRERKVHELSSLRWRWRRTDKPVAIAFTDDTGAFAFWAAKKGRLEVIDDVDGFAQCLWSGEHVTGATIDIHTGSALVEVRGARGDLLPHRMFVAEGQGAVAGVRVHAVVDRMGVLSFASIPCGDYALRALSQGSPPTFAVPAFTVTGPNWRRESAVAR